MSRPYALRSRISPLRALLFSALLLTGAGACRAQTTFSVSLNTNSLVGHANGPFSLDFQFSDGSGTSDGNNTATLSGFTFGGGSAAGTATASGGAAGNLTSGITLKDTSFFSELFQSFTPGSLLKFNVALTGAADAGVTPDEFSFTILDSTLSPVGTTDPGGAFLIADITPQGITKQAFAGTGAYATIGAPTLGSPVPELSTGRTFGLILAASLLVLGCGKAARSRRAV